MDALTLARLQFGITTVYHFFFVPLTLGLSILVALIQTQYVRTGNEEYKRMAKFWGKLLLINFAMGVVTGIVQEFQFGMNWSEYSRFVGDIFGAPLAVEALVAFFIESTFLGVWIFGADKLSKQAHLASIWLVALASNMSAFWILVANSFMQNPVGYKVAGERLEMVDFFALIQNPNVWLQFPHVALGGLSTAVAFMMGISAYHLLRNRHPELVLFRRSMNIAMTVGVFAILGTMFFGHLQGQRMADTQPMKLAAAEGLWEDEDPAGLSMFQIGDEVNREAIINIRIPSLLSVLTYDTPDGKVRGINSLQVEYEQLYGEGVDYAPPFIWLTYWSFRAMVGAGVAQFLIILGAMFLVWRGMISNQKWFLRLLMFAIALPYLANSTGWILAEVGRAPWVVYGLMRLEEAVSPNVGVVALLITLVGFTLLYGALMVADVYLLQKYAREGSTDDVVAMPKPGEETSLKGAY